MTSLIGGTWKVQFTGKNKVMLTRDWVQGGLKRCQSKSTRLQLKRNSLSNLLYNMVAAGDSTVWRLGPFGTAQQTSREQAIYNEQTLLPCSSGDSKICVQGELTGLRWHCGLCLPWQDSRRMPNHLCKPSFRSVRPLVSKGHSYSNDSH